MTEPSWRLLASAFTMNFLFALHKSVFSLTNWTVRSLIIYLPRKKGVRDSAYHVESASAKFSRNPEAVSQIKHARFIIRNLNKCTVRAKVMHFCRHLRAKFITYSQSPASTRVWEPLEAFLSFSARGRHTAYT